MAMFEEHCDFQNVDIELECNLEKEASNCKSEWLKRRQE